MSSLLLRKKQIVDHGQHFFQCGSGTSWSAVSTVSLLTKPVSLEFFSSPLMLLFVHHLFVNSFVNSVALYSFN